MRGTGHKYPPRRGMEYLNRFERATLALDTAGAQPPEVRPLLNAAYIRARKRLENYLLALEKEVNK